MKIKLKINPSVPSRWPIPQEIQADFNVGSLPYKWANPHKNPIPTWSYMFGLWEDGFLMLDSPTRFNDYVRRS